MQETIQVIVIYKSLKLQVFYFIFILKIILQNLPMVSNYNNWVFLYEHVKKHITINKTKFFYG
jgi:hypothetical protein